MIGLDTNFLVRVLTQDDPLQSRQAAAVLEHRLTEENPGYISLVTIAETVWVLQSFYGFADEQVVAAVERLIGSSSLVVQNEREVFSAMHALRSGEASFSDALIGSLGAWAGCSTTLTFDRKAARLPQFTLL